MKKIVRMIVFSAAAIYLTSLWNRGFTVKLEWLTFVEASLLVAAVYYILVPLSKVILFPFNIITLGLASAVAYILLFYLLLRYMPFVSIKSWTFPGISAVGVTIKSTFIGLKTNVVISSVSIATIINLLESCL